MSMQSNTEPILDLSLWEGWDFFHLILSSCFCAELDICTVETPSDKQPENHADS